MTKRDWSKVRNAKLVEKSKQYLNPWTGRHSDGTESFPDGTESFPDGNKSAKEFYAEIKSKIVEALENDKVQRVPSHKKPLAPKKTKHTRKFTRKARSKAAKEIKIARSKPIPCPFDRKNCLRDDCTRMVCQDEMADIQQQAAARAHAEMWAKNDLLRRHKKAVAFNENKAKRYAEKKTRDLAEQETKRTAEFLAGFGIDVLNPKSEP